MICDYGCGQEAKFPFKNGKWCCSKNYNSCPSIRKKISEAKKGKNTGPLSEEHKKKIGEANKGKKKGPLSEEHKKRISKTKIGQLLSKKTKRKIREAKKFTLKNYKEKYPFLFVVEELRENKNREIQVHCKNHECENSKEKGGWFTPSSIQLIHRIVAIESPRGFGESNFYCSQHCKDTCILYRRREDPFKNNILPYTADELSTFNNYVLKIRDKEICIYCGEHATIVHHIRPKKLEPFFALDPDYAISVCIKCHYKYGHKTGTECSTGNLAKIVCSVESQKFLNQK